jgi:hypothetical protein
MKFKRMKRLLLIPLLLLALVLPSLAGSAFADDGGSCDPSYQQCDDGYAPPRPPSFWGG